MMTNFLSGKAEYWKNGLLSAVFAVVSSDFYFPREVKIYYSRSMKIL